MDGTDRARRLGRLSHELRTPLTVVSGRIQIWWRRAGQTGGDVAVTRDELAAMVEAVDRLTAAVSEAERELDRPVRPRTGAEPEPDAG